MNTVSPDIKLAFLGCGRVAQHHRKILTSGVVSGYKVTAVCDTDQGKADNMAATFDSRAFTDAATMLDKTDADLVLILTPSGMHYAHAKAALEAGYNVATEKPITLLAEQAYELGELARAKGKLYTVIFQNRLNPAILLLRSAIDEGRFGTIISATIRVRWCRYQEYYEDGWHGTWAQDGGVINQQAIHHVDALGWLCGPIESVCATAARRLNRLEAEDTMVAVLKFNNGALGTIEATTAARPRDFEASLSVVGEEGMAVIGGIALNKVETWTFTKPRPEDTDAPATHSRDVPNGYGLSHGPFLQKLIDTLKSGSIEPPVAAADGARAVELVHALYASWERGCWVNLADMPLSKKLGQSS